MVSKQMSYTMLGGCVINKIGILYRLMVYFLKKVGSKKLYVIICEDKFIYIYVINIKYLN